jgi:flagellar assembly factor FliW
VILLSAPRTEPPVREDEQPRSTEQMSVMTEIELPTMTLASDLIGLPDLRRFVLVRIDEEGMLLSMRSLDEEKVRFVVVPAVAFFPDFAPEIDDDTAAMLGLTTADDALLLLIVTVGTSLRTSTANLRAPIVVNRHSMAAAQVVLDEDLALKAPLLPA